MKNKLLLLLLAILFELGIANSQMQFSEQVATVTQNKSSKSNESQDNLPEDFPANYVVSEWWPSAFKGQYVFLPTNEYIFVHGGIGNSEIYDIGTWKRKKNIISIKIHKRFGIRPIGEPNNPEAYGAANPEDYLTYNEYVKFENWLNKRTTINLDNFLGGDCKIDTTLKATEILVDSTNYLIRGKYKKASCRLLSNLELDSLSKSELRIMRNEIFARYGYIFKSQDLRKHFLTTDWYSPRLENADIYLTDIEKSNIALILKYEKK